MGEAPLHCPEMLMVKREQERMDKQGLDVLSPGALPSLQGYLAHKKTHPPLGPP